MKKEYNKNSFILVEICHALRCYDTTNGGAAEIVESDILGQACESCYVVMGSASK